MPPSLPRHPTDSPLTYAAGVRSGGSSDSPSLDRRTVAVNSHPAHSGAPLPGAGQSGFGGYPEAQGHSSLQPLQGSPLPGACPPRKGLPTLGQAPDAHLTQSALPTHPTSAGDTAHLPKGRHRGVPALAVWEPLPCKTAAPGPIGLHGVPQLGVGP